jgi:hypothetical protein
VSWAICENYSLRWISRNRTQATRVSLWQAVYGLANDTIRLRSRCYNICSINSLISHECFEECSWKSRDSSNIKWVIQRQTKNYV